MIAAHLLFYSQLAVRFGTFSAFDALSALKNRRAMDPPFRGDAYLRDKMDFHISDGMTYGVLDRWPKGGLGEDFVRAIEE